MVPGHLEDLGDEASGHGQDAPCVSNPVNSYMCTSNY